MKPRLSRWIIATVLVLSMVGCSTITSRINQLTGAQKQKEAELATLRAEYDGKIAAKASEVSSAKDGVIAAKDAQIKGAANGLYGADAVFKSVTIPTRTDLVAHNFVIESWAALGNPLPDYAMLVKINERVTKELDETKTSIADLQKSHSAALAENQKLTDTTKIWSDKLAASEKQRADLETQYRTNLDAKQQDIIALQQKIVAAETARADDAKAIQEAKTKASAILGGLALLCVVGVIYSPVGKTGLIIFGSICGLAAVAIWVIKVWMVLTVCGVGVVGLVGYALYTHRKEEKLSDALVLGFEDVKNESSDLWAKIAPKIQERLKSYKKENGKLVTKEDPSMQALIDKKLADFDHL